MAKVTVSRGGRRRHRRAPPPAALRGRPDERVPDDARHHTYEDENEEYDQEDAPWLHERGAAEGGWLSEQGVRGLPRDAASCAGRLVAARCSSAADRGHGAAGSDAAAALPPPPPPRHSPAGNRSFWRAAARRDQPPNRRSPSPAAGLATQSGPSRPSLTSIQQADHMRRPAGGTGGTAPSVSHRPDDIPGG